MFRLFAGDIASGVELMGMPMPTLIQSFKTIESGHHNCSGSSFQTVSCVKKVIFSFYFIQYVFPFVPLKMWAVKIQKQSVLKNENTNYFGIAFT